MSRAHSTSAPSELSAASEALSPPSSSLSRKLAALAGVTGAMTGGAEAEADLVRTPTAGVVAAVGIPGFSFVSASEFTLGQLRGPVSPGSASWDLDGDGSADFALLHSTTTFPATQGLAKFRGATTGKKLLFKDTSDLANVAEGAEVSAGIPSGWSFATSTISMTFGGSIMQDEFLGGAGQFGFSFTAAGGTYYGWGSLVIDLQAVGEGFKITEAYYQSTPDAAISVGQVPVAVPEPASLAFYSNMALLALGSAGVKAWRARRGQGC